MEHAVSARAFTHLCPGKLFTNLGQESSLRSRQRAVRRGEIGKPSIMRTLR